MARYQFWDKLSDIYTPGTDPKIKGLTYSTAEGTNHFTAEEWAALYPWIKIPGAKMIVTTGIINGGVCMEFEQTKAVYKQNGAAITDDMTDEEVLAAIEDFEDNPPQSDESTPEERIAAALELQNLIALPDENAGDPDTEAE